MLGGINEGGQMKRALVVLWMVTFAAAASAWAQPPAGPPKPGPEHKKLDYFAGKWSIEGEMKAGPWGPGGKTTGTESCEWFEGGFHLTCHSTGTGPMGKTKGLSLLGYSSEGKHYTFYGIDSSGWNDGAKGALEGDTWTWNSESTMGGQPLKTRFVIKQLAPDSYTFKAEASLAGAPFAVMFEGKETRIK
jgi:hypothetical protein